MTFERHDPWSLVRHVFCRIFCPCKHGLPPQPPRIAVAIKVGPIAISFFGDFQMQLPDDKTATGTAKFVDAKGNAAPVQGAPVWATDRTDLLTVTDNGDGSAKIEPVGPLGTAQVTCTADADLGSGVTEVVLLGDIEVIGGQAVGGTIDFAIN